MWAVLPEHIDVLLETGRLARLLEHEAPDLTCHVEAGITLADLQAHLATKGQQLALDPPDAAQATIGGLLASNASGPKRLRYGSARDLVIGLRVVQANGESHSQRRSRRQKCGRLRSEQALRRLVRHARRDCRDQFQIAAAPAG